MKYLLIQCFDNHLWKVPFKYLALKAEPQKEHNFIYEPVSYVKIIKNGKKKKSWFFLALFTKRALCSPWEKHVPPNSYLLKSVWIQGSLKHPHSLAVTKALTAKHLHQPWEWCPWVPWFSHVFEGQVRAHTQPVSRWGNRHTAQDPCSRSHRRPPMSSSCQLSPPCNAALSTCMI